MKRPDHAYIVAITDGAERWIRRCNGRPEGHPVGRVNLRVALAAGTDVRVDGEGRIAWRAGIHEFTAEPVGTAEPRTSGSPDATQANS